MSCRAFVTIQVQRNYVCGFGSNSDVAIARLLDVIIMLYLAYR